VKTSIAVLAGAVAFSAFAARADVPNPTVTGPIASTAVPGDASHNYVFFSTNHPLAVNGYVEEEYFVKGTGNVYDGAGNLTTTPPTPYETRIVVRRPADKARFNGTVLVEWYNVTNGFDAENVWFFAWEHVVRAGYAWVGVSAQPVGVNRLKGWGSRYADFSVPFDGLAYDIFSQAGQAIRHPANIDVLGGLKPKTFLAMGESQSAQRLSVYVNAIMPPGIYDGVLLLSTFGQAVHSTAVPIFKVLFEWDTQTGEANVRQFQSDAAFRWEVAGTAHVDDHLRSSREPLELRDLAGVSSEANAAPHCTVPSIGSQVPNHYVVDAAIDHLVRWVQTGRQPPTSPLFEIASFGPGNAAAIARDGFGMAKGGIRLSQIEVPTAANVGQNTPLDSLGGACPRWGYHLPFDLATLESLYPNHKSYLDAVVRVTRANVRNGFLLSPDALQTVQEAMSTSVGGGKPVDNREWMQFANDPDFR
jgi:hypothetical protein